MFDDAGVWLIMTGIVDNGISLIVGRIFDTGLKADGAPIEFTVAKVKILINRPAIDELMKSLPKSLPQRDFF